MDWVLWVGLLGSLRSENEDVYRKCGEERRSILKARSHIAQTRLFFGL